MSYKLKFFLPALVLPGAGVALVVNILQVESTWLFAYLAFVLTLASLLLAWTLSDWFLVQDKR